MIETLKAMILDFHESQLEPGVPRRISLQAVSGKASVCIGVRRSGKSTYLFQIIQRLLNHNVPRQNILYLNFFDDRLHGLQQAGIGLVTEAYYALFPEKKNVETVYCFFDEIQTISGWEPFVDRLMRSEKCQVYLTGSSARMLSKEIATQMRGRALSWEMFPFSFREFLDYKGIDGAGPLSTRRRLLVQKAFTEYWQTGGFPEVLGLPRQLRVKMHQEYFHAVLFRDLVERHDVAHPKAVDDLAHWLVDIFYYKSASGREVDFVVPSRRGASMLIQVCETLAEPQARQREVAALIESMTDLNVKSATIVTRAQSERIKTDAGTIEVVPIWKFLLDLPESKE